MPPAAKRNASVIVYDVKTSPGFADKARKCLLDICIFKWMQESKDITKLILINTKESKNKIYGIYRKCPHVYTATDVISYDPKLILPHIQAEVAKANADWLVGLAAALEELQDEFSQMRGVMNLQLLFITDLSTPAAGAEKQITLLINQLNKMNVFLYILGPDVKIPSCMSTFDDVKNWMRTVEFVADEGKNLNLRIAKRIVQNTNGIICNLRLGQELFKCYNNRWGLQAWKVPLTIGNCFQFSTATPRLLRRENPPKFKANVQGGYGDAWKWHLVDDVTETVPYDNVIGGVFKHGKFVSLPEDVEKNFKYSGPRCFKILGFTDTKRISEIYLQSDGSCYVESDGSKGLKLLIHVLHQENKCIIAKKSYNQNCKPKLVALFPDVDRGILILTDLPYAENLRVNFTETDISETPDLDDSIKSSSVYKDMYTYLQKLDVTDTNVGDDGRVMKPVMPSLTSSLRISTLSSRSLKKYLGEEVDFDYEELEGDLYDYLVDTSDYKQYLPPKPEKESKKKQMAVDD